MSINLTPGQVFAGEFEVQRLLSTGGMGAVYVALQRSTGKLRALKVMLPQLITGGTYEEVNKFRQRFMAEAQAGARVASDHVVEVVVAGVDGATGAPWLAMELLEGESLEQRLVRGALSLTEAREVFDPLCHALSAAHRVGLFHLDLKPDNVFLARARSSRGGTTVKVLDFGIARLVSEKQQSATMTTAMGSPLWMSPEQSRAGSMVGPFTDVWALGLLAFKCLTGRYYWRGANTSTHEVNVAEWLVEMASTDRVAASVRARELGVFSPLPQGFDAWFARCVNVDPAARFQDASAAMAALAPMLPTNAGPQDPFALAQNSVIGAPAAPVFPTAYVTPPQPFSQPPIGSGTVASPHGANPFAGAPVGSATVAMDFSSGFPHPAYGAPPTTTSFATSNARPAPKPRSNVVLFLVVGGLLSTLMLAAVVVFLITDDGGDPPAHTTLLTTVADAGAPVVVPPPRTTGPVAEVGGAAFVFYADHVEGLVGVVPNGAACTVLIGAANSERHCRLTITCGTTLLYGVNQNYVPECDSAQQIVVQDPQTTNVDRDPSVRIDRNTHRIEMADDATGTYQAFSLGGPFTEP